VILLDTLGELTFFYQASDLVFVGGSLVPQGGHNLVEPAAFRRAILTGPHLHHFQSVAESLVQGGGIVVVQSVAELEKMVQRLIEDPEARQTLGAKAYQVIQGHRGATARTVELILRLQKENAP
jgi:3-deoxy-D-manno-octulosonic-acid transferase